MKLYEALNEIEELNPSQIALKLMSEGITGRRCAAESCPFANWIAKRCDSGASVSGMFVLTFDPDYSPGGIKEMASTPSNVAQFVQNFDQGLYSGLSEGGDE